MKQVDQLQVSFKKEGERNLADNSTLRSLKSQLDEMNIRVEKSNFARDNQTLDYGKIEQNVKKVIQDTKNF